MTGTVAASALVDRGMCPPDADAKRDLFDLVLRAFERIPAERHVHSPRVWWIPGRLEVFGKHTDYAGGRSIVCAVPRGLAIAARPRGDGIVNVVDARREESVTLEAWRADGSRQFTGWRHYVEVAADRLARNFPGSELGADVVFASDLPRAAGMSSSSALVVGVATALVAVAAIDRRPEWHGHIEGPLDAAGYYACIENGLTFGTLAGDAGVGTHGGSEDHAAILAGVPGHLSEFAFVPLRYIDSAAVPEDWRFVLAPSGVKSEKTGRAQEAYNRLARGTELLLELWNGAEAPAASLGRALGSEPSAADRLRGLLRRSDLAGWSPAPLEKRLDHFIREDARVQEALQAFLAADAGVLSRLSEASQSDAETLLGNQIAETIEMARSARERGAFAACSFGAGFGGSVWALVDRNDAEAFARRWHPNAFVALPGPPLAEL